jgi:hypothetical protein
LEQPDFGSSLGRLSERFLPIRKWRPYATMLRVAQPQASEHRQWVEEVKQDANSSERAVPIVAGAAVNIRNTNQH